VRTRQQDNRRYLLTLARFAGEGRVRAYVVEGSPHPSFSQREKE
jgi:hypothetical protein